jgi:hypothetical protein
MSTLGWFQPSGAKKGERPAPPPSPADHVADEVDARLWALTAASCGAMGMYVPLGCWQWAILSTEKEVLSLPGSQVMFATLEGDSVVVDCLVPDPGAPGSPRVPLALRGRLPRRRHRRRAPAPLRRWAARGEVVDVSLRDRRGSPVARLYGRHAQAVLELEAPIPALVTVIP